jgi:hypothetical protein
MVNIRDDIAKVISSIRWAMLNSSIFQCQGDAPYGNDITATKDKYCEQLLM